MDSGTAALASAIGPFRVHGLIRLAVGLESADDLINDLEAALSTTYGPSTEHSARVTNH